MSEQPLTMQVQQPTPLLIDARTVAEVLGIGLSCLYSMDRSGELGPQGLYLRRRRLWPVEEIQAWVRAGCPRREVWAVRKNDESEKIAFESTKRRY